MSFYQNGFPRDAHSIGPVMKDHFNFWVQFYHKPDLNPGRLSRDGTKDLCAIQLPKCKTALEIPLHYWHRKHAFCVLSSEIRYARFVIIYFSLQQWNALIYYWCMFTMPIDRTLSWECMFGPLKWFLSSCVNLSELFISLKSEADEISWVRK